MNEINKISKGKIILSGVIPVIILAGMIFYLFGPSANLLDFGTPLPEITIEKIEFHDSKIIATVRNTGPIDVKVIQADVNDRIQPAAIEPDKHLLRYESADVIIPFEWNEAEPYEIGLTVNDGTRFTKSVEAAAHVPEQSLELVTYFAIIGTYVGIVPVMIGLLWFPFISKMGPHKYKFFLALTVGLLLFLGIDAVVESLEISTENLADSFNGSMLIATVVIVSFLGLYYSSEKLVSRYPTSNLTKPVIVALMISIGIGLHNFGEGLAIGAAIGIGAIALSKFLIVGFTLHNTTEGLAIVAPMARTKPMIGKIVAMGVIAGAPAIFGAWIGGFVYSPFTSVIFLSIGAGAIFQVVISILKWIKEEQQSFFSAPTVSGLAVGMFIMYFTSILV
jgi:zinc transporter ZupT